jgi:hypothetical protein
MQQLRQTIGSERFSRVFLVLASPRQRGARAERKRHATCPSIVFATRRWRQTSCCRAALPSRRARAGDRRARAGDRRARARTIAFELALLACAHAQARVRVRWLIRARRRRLDPLPPPGSARDDGEGRLLLGLRREAGRRRRAGGGSGRRRQEADSGLQLLGLRRTGFAARVRHRIQVGWRRRCEGAGRSGACLRLRRSCSLPVGGGARAGAWSRERSEPSASPCPKFRGGPTHAPPPPPPPPAATRVVGPLPSSHAGAGIESPPLRRRYPAGARATHPLGLNPMP